MGAFLILTLLLPILMPCQLIPQNYITSQFDLPFVAIAAAELKL